MAGLAPFYRPLDGIRLREVMKFFLVCLEEWRRWKEEIQTYCWRNTLLVVLHRNYDCVWFHVCFQDGDDCRPKWKGDPEEIATHLIVLCNATFRLKCPAEGKPKPIIRWLKNGLDFTRREKGNVCMLYAWMQNLIEHLHAVLDLLLRSVCISCLFLSMPSSLLFFFFFHYYV